LGVTPVSGNAYIRCDSVTTVHWIRVNNSWPESGYLFTPTVLLIPQVEVADGGMYECQGVYKYGGIFYARAILKIQGRFFINNYILL